MYPQIDIHFVLIESHHKAFVTLWVHPYTLNFGESHLMHKMCNIIRNTSRGEQSEHYLLRVTIVTQGDFILKILHVQKIYHCAKLDL